MTTSPQTIHPNQKETIVLRDLASQTITVERDGKLLLILALTRGATEKSRIDIKLTGAHAEVDIVGLIIGEKTEEFPFETEVEHCAPSTRAHTYLRGVLNGASKIDFKGMITIQKNAKLSDAYLAHHTLLLSEASRCRTIPALEIEADDVKAGHAASIGKVDPESLFYIVSRGVSGKEAERIVVEGFLEEGLRRIPEPKMRDAIRAELLAHLHA